MLRQSSKLIHKDKRDRRKAAWGALKAKRALSLPAAQAKVKPRRGSGGEKRRRGGLEGFPSQLPLQ